MQRWIGSLIALVVVLAVEPRAEACSGCDGTSTAPSSGTVMPVNAVGACWRGWGDGSEIVLRDVESGLAIELTSTQQPGGNDLLPTQPLEPGRSYRFEFPDVDCTGPSQIEFTTSPAIRLGTFSLGTLLAMPPEITQIEVPESVSCSVYAEAVSVRIELARDPLLDPFADLLLYETLVDGERWSHMPRFFGTPKLGSSWVGRGVDVLFTACENGGGEGVPPGVHEVQMRARMPGMPGVVLESSVVEIALECPEISDESDDDDDSGESGSFVIPIDRADAEGCACNSSTPTHRRSIAPLLLVFAAGMLGRARRRGV
jgi:hypothetical protein